jgi:hypothetical protein
VRDTKLVVHTAMELGAGPKIGDAASLWNFTPSPGWTKEEVFALKLALEKFGIGKWVQITQSGVLPGKLIQQLNGQTQRLLGQQSLAGAFCLRGPLQTSARAQQADRPVCVWVFPPLVHPHRSFHRPACRRGCRAAGQRGEAGTWRCPQRRARHQLRRCVPCSVVPARSAAPLKQDTPLSLWLTGTMDSKAKEALRRENEEKCGLVCGGLAGGCQRYSPRPRLHLVSNGQIRAVAGVHSVRCAAGTSPVHACERGCGAAAPGWRASRKGACAQASGRCDL